MPAALLPRLIAATLCLFCSAALPATPPETLAERMLAALGGRAAWAAASNTRNDSQQNRAGDPPVVRSVITMDFARPRFRIETTGPGLHLVRVIDGERSWRKTREGRIEAVPPELLADELRWYAGHVYRTIHRVARRDPALSLSVGQDGRLQVHEGNARIAWFKLDVRGEPYAFGAHADDVGTLSGPWDFEQDGLRQPMWVSNPDGTWRAMVKSLAVNVPLDAALFARPADTPASPKS
jgi:hypothetical protein